MAGLLQLAPFEDANRRLLTNTSVPFYLPGTSTLAALFSDALGTTPAPNPVATDAYGNLPAVYAGPGRYEYEVRGLRLLVEVASPFDHGAHAGARRIPGAWTAAGTVPGNVAYSSGWIYVQAFLVDEDIPVDVASIHVSTPQAGATHHGVVYLDNGSLFPGSLLYSTGALDASVAGGPEAAAAFTIPRGLVWVGGMGTGATPANILGGYGTGHHLPYFFSKPTTHYHGAIASGGGTLTEPPATFPASGAFLSNSAPRLHMRMA